MRDRGPGSRLPEAPSFTRVAQASPSSAFATGQLPIVERRGRQQARTVQFDIGRGRVVQFKRTIAMQADHACVRPPAVFKDNHLFAGFCPAIDDDVEVPDRVEPGRQYPAPPARNKS